ncbi:MAG: site-specific DNA-methyltransferase [Candidatus Wallbacteria bacterium]|nr:site-specific DNA-methyltransferase [Candidatus Wallbacteria bacterium]
MPTLQFKGKNIIWNHHLAIPYHTLDDVQKLDFRADQGEGNLIIEGDNLLALKALLPQYAGKIKCVYIDPPYNTGNEGWVYNDNVNSPLLKDWLGKEVGKDDLTRHDKWLCMIIPRLKLLRDLLSDDGAIFISIDDNEQHSLRLIMDEVFGHENFIANVLWQKRTSPDSRKLLGDAHEFIVCYAKNSEIFAYLMNKLALNEEHKNNFKNPDNDPKGPWVSTDFTAQGYRPNQMYTIKTPSGKTFKPPEGRCWVQIETVYQRLVAEGRMWFGNDGNGIPRRKTYLNECSGSVPWTWWSNKEVGHNQEAKKEIIDIFESATAFETPKPTRLIKRIIEIASSEDSIILDSFAGSGTTMHAVMDLNKEDGGNRKCIMIQMTEATKADPKKNICKDITRERVKRAIEKNGYQSGFKYLKVGIPIDAESLLSGNLPTYRQFAKYVYYLCTGEIIADEKKIDEKTYFVGTFKKNAVYLVYTQDFDQLTRLALNLDIAEKVTKKHKGQKCIVYAPACFLEEEYLNENNIEFVGIPYNLFNKNGQ